MSQHSEISNLIKSSVLCWLATVDQRGAPSVSPKEIWGEDDNGNILIADIMSANSVRNMRANPNVCVSFLDIFRQKGFKLYGRAEIIERGDDAFMQIGAALIEAAGETFHVRNIIKVHVERTGAIIAPSYKLFADTDEAEMMAQAYQTYGVAPLE